MWGQIAITKFSVAVNANIRGATRLLGMLMAIKLFETSIILQLLMHSVRFLSSDQIISNLRNSLEDCKSSGSASEL